LTGCVVLGPRLGRFNSEGKPNPGFDGHNATLVMLGAIILWFGWYGFNPGSTLGVTGGLANVSTLPDLAIRSNFVLGRSQSCR
jgi:Amt family ammonium transporter